MHFKLMRMTALFHPRRKMDSGNDAYGRSRNPSRSFLAFVEDLDIPQVRFHGLRHT
jgi:hypothetical protein